MNDENETYVPGEGAAGRRLARRSERHTLWRRYRELPKWQATAIGVPLVILACALLVAGIDVAASAGRIHPGVEVSGVNVGGIGRQEAVMAIETELAKHVAAPVSVRFEDASWTVTAAQLGAAVDAERAVQAAFSVGRRGGASAVLADRFRAWFGGVDIDAPVSSDTSLTAVVVDSIARSVDKPPVDAGVAIEGTSARLVPSALGIAMKKRQFVDDLLRAMVSGERAVQVAVEFVPVDVTDGGAEQALAQAKAMLSDGVAITYEDETWRFSATEIAKWIAFRPVPAQEESGTAGQESAQGAVDSSESVAAAQAPVPGAMVLQAYIDANEASRTVTPRVGAAGRPPVDARFKVAGGAVTIVPSQDGVGPDMAALALELTRTLISGGERTVELRTQRVEPELTTEVARTMGIKERISTYTTTYEPGNKPRVNNIHTLASAIDGTLIAPGGTFSFNGAAGPRTADKGYQEAPAIVNGKLVPQLGGGICQVNTTLFNAVFESGLPVLERRNHSFYISHYPKGRDATVSWGGPDLKFKNDTSNWVLVATGYSNSSLTVSIYGTDPGYDVKALVGEWIDIKPHPVKEVLDPTMPVGTRVVEDSGVDGRQITVKRIVTLGGKTVREDAFKSFYKTKEEIVRVGTKPVDSGSTTATP